MRTIKTIRYSSAYYLPKVYLQVEADFRFFIENSSQITSSYPQNGKTSLQVAGRKSIVGKPRRKLQEAIPIVGKPCRRLQEAIPTSGIPRCNMRQGFDIKTTSSFFPEQVIHRFVTN